MCSVQLLCSFTFFHIFFGAHTVIIRSHSHFLRTLSVASKLEQETPVDSMHQNDAKDFNKKIKNHIQANFGKIITITKKRHKDRLISGIGIVTMNKRELEQKPLPSYIIVDGFELCVTYIFRPKCFLQIL